MTYLKYLPLLAATVFPIMTYPAYADQIPYPTPGKLAAQSATYATGNGINAYYLGSTASFQDQIDIFDVQTGWRSGKLLDNKLTTPGTMVSIGTGAGEINTGDQLIFFIDSPDGRFASMAEWSPDGVNHAYMTAFSGGTVNGKWVPAGTFVGMEDLSYGHSDLNYNDVDFVFTGVQSVPASATPEPASLLLLATGLLAVLGARALRRNGA